MPATDAGTRRFKVVVTGTGRSATGFAAAWLTSAGMPCGHETFFNFAGWENAVNLMRRQPELMAESSWMAAPFLNEPQLAEALLIHQVRHPRKVAESCMRHPPGTTPPYLDFLEAHCPEVAKYEDDLNKAVARWVYWNQRIGDACQGRDSYFWRVEDGEAGLLAWLQDRGAVGNVVTDRLYADKQHNAHRHDEQAEARLEDIAVELQAPLLEMMERYGYDTWEGL